MTGFDEWLDTYVSEAELDTEHRFEVEGPQWGWNSIPLSAVLETVKQCSAEEKRMIKSKIVEIDFRNGDPMHFFEYLAKGMAR